MDDIEWPEDKAKVHNGFVDAQDKPVTLLVGLTLGLGLGWITTLFLTPVLAPLPPLVVGGVMILLPRTQALALGLVAAVCGIVAFLVAMLVVQLIL